MMCPHAKNLTLWYLSPSHGTGMQGCKDGGLIVRPGMQDVFGNYVIQRILERRQEGEVSLLLKLMQGHVSDLAFNMYGCRVVQAILEVSRLPLS